MKPLVTPTLRISIGLLSLTLSLILLACSLGLFPNEEKTALEARSNISETLAVQLASLASRKDIDSIKDTIESVVSRNGDVLSIAVRGANGELLAGSKDYDDRAANPAGENSLATSLHVPLFLGEVQAGRIELRFRPLATSNNRLGVSTKLLEFICFIAVAGFLGYYFMLRRALRELDPSRAIPERVKAAFDTLAEGVLIMDEKERVLLANSAFVKKVAGTDRPMLGAQAGDLPWTASDAASAAPALPWRAAMRSGESVLGVAMGIKNGGGRLKRLLVNATRIVDGEGVVRGVIATFDDVTVLHEMNEQLNLSNQQLQLSQAKISEQNHKLQLLASTDPLTGCLNRRTFFEKAEQAFEDAVSGRELISFIMVDADHFKRINDRFGHGVGDAVLVGLADVLKGSCGPRDLVGRYGGEEFCMAVVGGTEVDAERLAEHIRQAVGEVTTWLPNAERVTISLGIASSQQQTRDLADLVKRADEALYAAKNTGRNRVVNWTRVLSSVAESLHGQLAGGLDTSVSSERLAARQTR